MNEIFDLAEARIQRRRNILDTIMISIIGCWILAMGFTLYNFSTSYFSNSTAQIDGVYQLASNAFSLFVAYLVWKVTYRYLMRVWAPSYVIIEEENVLKVVGAVGLDDFARIKTRMAQMRPNYIVINDAFERFQCTMAAVPATPEEIDARRTLNLMGFKI